MTEAFTPYAVGLMCASVCTNLSNEQATERLNLARPTGVHPWFVSEDATFANGEPNPCPCEQGRDGCRHILFNC